jgi:hypothetical protein
LLLLLPLLAGLLLSAWFWLPALAETSYVQLTAQTTGYFFYGNHFRGADLVQRGLLFDYATGRDAGSPFAMGLIQALLTLTGAVALCLIWFRRRGVSRPGKPQGFTLGGQAKRVNLTTLSFAFVGLLLSSWLITPLSRPLWEHVPLLPLVQFPWRFLSIQALCAALLTGAIIVPIRARRPRLAGVSAVALGITMMSAALLPLQPDYLPIRAEEVTADRLQLYELFTGNVGSTIRYEYLPRWVKPRPYIGPEQLMPDTPPRAIPISGELLSARRLDRKPTSRVWHVETGSKGSYMAFPIYYWPGWYGRVDGKRVEAEPAAGSGYVSLNIPPGRHTVEIRLGRTPLRLAAEVVSLVSVLSLIGLGLGAWARNRRRAPETAESGPRLAARILESGIVCVPFLVLLSLTLVFHPRVSAASSRDLTMDFERMPYLHHNPDGVGALTWRLTSYGYGAPVTSTERITHGETLQVTLEWSRTDGKASAYPTDRLKLRLISPAAVRNEHVPAVAEAVIEPDPRQAAPGARGTSVVTMSVPRKIGPGIYLLQVDDTPEVYLRPVWMASDVKSADLPLRAAFAQGALRLHDIRAVQSAPDQLQVELDWSAVRPVAANYGLSLSLTDSAGNEWLRQGSQPGYDTQPGRGFLPTSLWPLHRVIHDRHSPSLEAGVPPGDSYSLTVDLYRVATWESVGQHTVAVALERTMERPDAPALAQFGQELVLTQVETAPWVWQGEMLSTNAYWSSLEKPSADYRVQWELAGFGGSITATKPLAPGSSPTDWPVGAWVAGRTTLTIPPTTPPGTRTLTLTVIDPRTNTPTGSYTHPTPVEVRQRDRVWEVPEMEEKVGARFGDMIELAGYDLARGGDSLKLTLYWRSLTTPDRHYMFFVHLADPQTGEPVSQVDSMPREFTYPTGQWAPEEVVSDIVQLSTEDVAPGRYDLAIGWYDPDTEVRLQAMDGDGAPLPDDRLVLPNGVTVR